MSRPHLGRLFAAAPLTSLAFLAACTPPTVTAPSVGVTAACVKDVDCKADRICDQGQCVAPGEHALPVTAVQAPAPGVEAPPPAASLSKKK